MQLIVVLKKYVAKGIVLGSNDGIDGKLIMSLAGAQFQNCIGFYPPSPCWYWKSKVTVGKGYEYIFLHRAVGFNTVPVKLLMKLCLV